MKLLFIGCRPSAALDEAMRKQNIELTFAPSVAAAETAEVVAWKITAAKDLAELPKLRRKLPKAWIAVIVPETWLKDPEIYGALLGATEKNDVWFDTNWEATFWLALQRAVQNKLTHHREMRMEAELEQIKGEQEALLEKLEKDAQLTREVHEKLYPRFSPDIPGVELFSKYVPASGSGGDYFDVFEFGDRRRFGLLLADAHAHRTAASLLTALLKVRPEELRGPFADSAKFMAHLNAAIAAELPEAKDSMHLAYGVFDRGSLQMHLTLAGLFVPRMERGNGWERLDLAANPALVAAPSTEFRSQTLQCKPGNRFLLCSDGLEAALPVKTGGLDAFLKKNAGADTLELRNALMGEVDNYRSTLALADDITFILLQVDAKALYVSPTTPLRQR